MKGITIREFMGDYALDIPMGDRSVHTIYFNSRRNAETVKRIMEVDDSVPNAATVCDMVEVVRCEKCKYVEMIVDIIGNPKLFCGIYHTFPKVEVEFDHFCGYGKRKEQT